MSAEGAAPARHLMKGLEISALRASRNVDVNLNALTDVAIKYQPSGPKISESHTDKANLRHLFRSSFSLSRAVAEKDNLLF
jgi:hypothetical protein